jgi:antitoxin component of RelBE/YafQ-DinJ toxin-antitoxin module
MSKTLTYRTDESLREALEKRAKRRGISLSQAVRVILKDALEERQLAEKTGYLRGSLSLR